MSALGAGDGSAGDGGAPSIDLRRVLAEIDDEVARRRASGEIPADLERELDATFARFSPAASAGAGDPTGLAAAERSAFIDVDVPTGSGLPGGPVVKKALRKGMAWYLRYLAQQSSAFNAAAVAALHRVDARLTALEETSPAASPHLRAALEAHEVAAPSPAQTEVAVGALRGAPGRVLVADAGDGAVVRALAGAGVDAYGLDPSRALANRALADGLDVRVGEATTHLAGVAAGVLGGIVLHGIVDRLPAAGSLALAESAVLALAPGAALVIRSTSPVAWARALDPVVVDLSPGRPMSSATWVLALGRLGLAVEAVHDGPLAGELDDLPDGAPGAAIVNGNNEALRRALFGPASYVIVARRPR